jgi:hypothetical protein
MPPALAKYQTQLPSNKIQHNSLPELSYPIEGRECLCLCMLTYWKNRKWACHRAYVKSSLWISSLSRYIEMRVVSASVCLYVCVCVYVYTMCVLCAYMHSVYPHDMCVYVYMCICIHSVCSVCIFTQCVCIKAYITPHICHKRNMRTRAALT